MTSLSTSDIEMLPPPSTTSPSDLLPPRSNDDNSDAVKQKKPRKKKPTDKWTLLWFVPMPVLNRREEGDTGRLGKRDGFNTYNRLACKACRRTFHKAAGLETHACQGAARRAPARALATSAPRPRASPAIRSSSLGTRRSGRVAASAVRYREDEEVEVVGDTEMERKRAKKLDKNFSKMTLTDQRKAMEAFNNSTLDSEGESEDDSDIEVIDIDNEETPKAKKDVSRKTKKDDGEKALEKNADKKSDYVQVKSKSGKTMMVERARLKQVLGGEKITKLNKMKNIEIRLKRLSSEDTKKVEDEKLLAEDDDDITVLEEAGSPMVEAPRDNKGLRRNPPRKRMSA